MEDELAARRTQEEPGFPREVIDKVKAENPGVELRMFTSEENDSVICKQPSRGEYKRFKTMVVEPSQKAMALEVLLGGCCVYPDRTGLSVLLERRPAYAEVFGEKLAGWAGAGQEVTEKKL